MEKELNLIKEKYNTAQKFLGKNIIPSTLNPFFLSESWIRIFDPNPGSVDPYIRILYLDPYLGSESWIRISDPHLI